MKQFQQILFIIYTLQMEGFLQIWHGFFSRWATYYFRTHQDTLIFGPKRQQVQGTVHLKVAEIISIVDDPISFIIHTGTDTLRLRARSIDERVKWFKKLKKIQKGIQQQNYVKQLPEINYEKSKDNKIKMLESIVLDLWQSHADLSNQIDDIAQKFKSNPLAKTLTDKLRMTVQTIKLKNSQALRIIQQFTKSQRQKRGAGSNRGIYTAGSQINHSDYSNYHQPDGTLFMSFQDNKKKIFKKASKRQSEQERFSEFKEFRETPVSKRRVPDGEGSHSQVTPYKSQLSMRHTSKSRSFNTIHFVKQRLLQQNPVYKDVVSVSDHMTRNVLPTKFTPQQKFPVGQIMKNAIGGDLTKFALPVAVNQPLSMLQKGCEQMYYSNLLDKANQQDRPQRRMLYVVGFLISQYSLSDQRTKKPFNPLLGQTFQYYDQDRQFQYISEQVSHHPPISAMYCRSDNFQISDQSKAKTGFSGKSIQVTPQGKSRIRLQKYLQQEYMYDKCAIILTNVILSFSKTQLEVVGKMTVQCKKNDIIAVINFKESGFMSRSGQNQIEGDIKMNGQKVFALTGKWTQLIKYTDLQTQKTQQLWSRKHNPNKQYYYFNDYTMQLNHINKRILSEIAPTDSRLRPDQRALQYRRMDLADSQKLRLENKQRTKRKQNEQKKISHHIKWFKLEKAEDGTQLYVSNGSYQGDREKNDWANFPDIY